MKHIYAICTVFILFNQLELLAQEAQFILKNSDQPKPILSAKRIAEENAIIGYAGGYFIRPERETIGIIHQIRIEYLRLSNATKFITTDPFKAIMGNTQPPEYKIFFDGAVFVENNQYAFVTKNDIRKIVSLLELSTEKNTPLFNYQPGDLYEATFGKGFHIRFSTITPSQFFKQKITITIGNETNKPNVFDASLPESKKLLEMLKKSLLPHSLEI
jgi:hypothetical protein